MKEPKMDLGMIGKKYWVVEIKYNDGYSLEFTYKTREECRKCIRDSKEFSKGLGKSRNSVVSRKIYKVTVIHEAGGQVYKQPKS